MSLKIAFFGSDRFSVRSLARILNLGSVGSVDVITRILKPKGRNMTSYEDLPVGVFAASHNLNVLRADTKGDIMGILDRQKFDLAVAVSYGRLIPAEFIASMKYGGVNVHPSLLPRYSGSSPIQYALMNDDEYTGVTVQTLHPTKFDRGDIIVQSDQIPILDSDNYASLEAKLGDIGGDQLAHILDNKLYINHPGIVPKHAYSSAFRITPSMAKINWSHSARSIKRLYDALGPLYTQIFCLPKKKSEGSFKRVILQDIKEYKGTTTLQSPGSFVLEGDSLIVKTSDGAILADALTFECFTLEDAKTFHKRLGKRTTRAPHIFT